MSLADHRGDHRLCHDKGAVQIHVHHATEVLGAHFVHRSALNDAGIVNICKMMDFPELPIIAHLNAAKYKLYMADSGLMLSMLDEESQEDIRVRRDLGTWKGGFFENIIAEALVKAGATLAYHKKENSTLEMDFFLRSGECLVPVEVKSTNGKSKSMRTMLDSEHYKDIKWGVKLVRGDVGFNDNILTIPQWCAFMLPRLLKDKAVGYSFNRS